MYKSVFVILTTMFGGVIATVAVPAVAVRSNDLELANTIARWHYDPNYDPDSGQIRSPDMKKSYQMAVELANNCDITTRNGKYKKLHYLLLATLIQQHMMDHFIKDDKLLDEYLVTIKRWDSHYLVIKSLETDLDLSISAKDDKKQKVIEWFNIGAQYGRKERKKLVDEWEAENRKRRNAGLPQFPRPLLPPLDQLHDVTSMEKWFKPLHDVKPSEAKEAPALPTLNLEELKVVNRQYADEITVLDQKFKPRLKDIKNERIARIETSKKSAIAILEKQIVSIKEAIAKAKKEGDLDTVLLCQKQLESREAEKAVCKGDLVGIEAAEEKFEKEFSKLADEYKGERIKMRDDYLSRLDELIKSETMKDNIEKAKQIKAFRLAISESMIENSFATDSTPDTIKSDQIAPKLDVSKTESKFDLVVKPVKGTVVILADTTLGYDLYMGTGISSDGRKKLEELGRIVVIKNEVKGVYVSKSGEYTRLRVEGLHQQRTEWFVLSKHATKLND